MELQVTTKDEEDSFGTKLKAIYIGGLKLCRLELIQTTSTMHGPTWWIITRYTRYNTYSTTLDMAIQFCLEQAWYLERREGVHYHLVEIFQDTI